MAAQLAAVEGTDPPCERTFGRPIPVQQGIRWGIKNLSPQANRSLGRSWRIGGNRVDHASQRTGAVEDRRSPLHHLDLGQVIGGNQVKLGHGSPR